MKNRKSIQYVCINLRFCIETKNRNLLSHQSNISIINLASYFDGIEINAF